MSNVVCTILDCLHNSSERCSLDEIHISRANDIRIAHCTSCTCLGSSTNISVYKYRQDSFIKSYLAYLECLYIPVSYWEKVLTVPAIELGKSGDIVTIEQMIHRLHLQGLSPKPGYIFELCGVTHYMLVSAEDTAYTDKPYTALPAWPDLCVIQLNNMDNNEIR